MKILLTTLNCKYIHKNLALRWLYVANNTTSKTTIKEYTIKQNLDDIANEIINSDYDVIAFSVYIWNIEESLYIVNKVKQACTKHIIFGGPEVTYESFDLVHKGVDALSLGEGEQTFFSYITMLENKENYEIEGIYTKEYPNTKIVRSDLMLNESYESPYFLDIDKEEMNKRYFYFETSRGCPYLCQYCLSSSDDKVRMFSEDYIFNQLEKISNSNIKTVKLLDRTFNVMPKRALKIARYMNEHCKNQVFQFEIVAETLSEELLQFFEHEADKSRFRFEIGIQSFYEPTLTAVKRVQNNERLIEVLKRLQQAGIVMHTDLIAGLPYESYEQFKHSYNTLFELHTSEIQLGILKLLKGTALKSLKELYEFEYNEHPPYDVTSTKWLTSEEMIKINACAYATEKLYNHGRCKQSIDDILDNGLYSDAFSLLSAIGIELLNHPGYQVKDMFILIKKVLVNEDQLLVDAILNNDYYALFKNKVKGFTNKWYTIEEKKEIAKLFFDKGYIDQYAMHHMISIDKVYYKHKILDMVCIYQGQTYPTRYIVKEGEIINYE